MQTALKIGPHSLSQTVLMAPMTGISDLPFRRLASKLGAHYAPSEMVACAELSKSRPDVVRKAALGEHDGLKIVQLVGCDVSHIGQGARLMKSAGADIIDLNFGCPAKAVTGIQCGSALMRDLDLADRLIDAALESSQLPVTIKIRLGWDDLNINAREMAQRAEKLGVSAITVHARTRQQFYKGEANWQAVAAIKNAIQIPLIINGDIVDARSLALAMTQSKADAAMIGRGYCGRPWLASQLSVPFNGQNNDVQRQYILSDVIIEHFESSLSFYETNLGLKMFRKHLGWYVLHADIDYDFDFRRSEKARLCQLDDPQTIVANIKSYFGGHIIVS